MKSLEHTSDNLSRENTKNSLNKLSEEIKKSALDKNIALESKQSKLNDKWELIQSTELMHYLTNLLIKTDTWFKLPNNDSFRINSEWATINYKRSKDSTKIETWTIWMSFISGVTIKWLKQIQNGWEVNTTLKKETLRWHDIFKIFDHLSRWENYNRHKVGSDVDEFINLKVTLKSIK